MAKNKDKFQVNNYEFDYVERPKLDISDSYGLAKEPLDWDTSVDGWQNIVWDIDDNYSLIQQNQDDILLRVEKNDVINQINVSDEWILIDGENIQIDGTTTFSSGYDPSQKLESSDVGDLAFEDLVEEAKLGSTIIDGWYIQTDLLTADNIKTGTLTIDDASSSAPSINFEDSGSYVWYLAGDYNYSLTVGGSSFTVDAIRTSSSFIAGLDLVVEDDLIVNDDTVIAGWLDMGQDIDMHSNDINNVNDLYVQDIYWNGVSTIDVYENLDMSGNYIEGATAYAFDSWDQLTASWWTLYFNWNEVTVS